MKKNNILTFNITNDKGKNKLEECVSMTAKRGYFYHTSDSLIDKFLTRLRFTEKVELKVSA